MKDYIDPTAWGHTPKGSMPDCLIPWYGMELSYAGFMKTSCCEFLGRPFKLDSNRDNKISTLFDGDWFKRIRSAFANNHLEGSGCERCIYQRPKGLIKQPLDDLNPRQMANYEACINSYEARDACITHLPVRYSLCFTAACNLQCVMCSQFESRDATKGIELSSDFLLSNKKALSVAISALVSGGEPFVSKNCRAFINAVCQDPLLEDLHLHIVTNGQLLNEMQPVLNSKSVLWLHVSLDGVGNTYETVRRGGSWERVRKNIQIFNNKKMQLGKEKWKLSASSVLMKSSLPGLPGFILFCKENDIEIVLQPLMVTRENNNEDLINSEADKIEIKQALGYIDEAMTLIDQQKNVAAVYHLKAYRKHLVKASREIGKKSSARPPTSPNPEDLRGKKVAIWGTGTNYEWCWAGRLKKMLSDIDFVGFVDNDPDKWGKEIDGFPVYYPQALENRIKPEVIIVAAQIVYRDEIIDQIKEINDSIHIF